MPFAAVTALPRQVALQLLDWAARSFNCTVADLPGSYSERNRLRLLAQVTKECADVTSTYATALADGNLSPQEKQQILTEAAEAQKSLGALIEAMK